MALIPEKFHGPAARLLAPQRLGALAVVAAALALAVVLWVWSRTPDYRVLYSNLSERDGGSIVAALAQMNVPYRVAEGGAAILVPAPQVHEIRLKLAAQGLPRGGLVGFEIMEQSRLGTSQFLEQVNYHRALEGELARSIQSLDAVRSARVHLALPKPSAFVRERQKPSASVLLALHPGRTLDPAQVSAILHLVAASVPELSSRAVTVVDQNGTLLSAAGESPALDPAQIRYVQELEAGYIRRIEAILEPVLGRGQFRAQVSAEIDFSQSERAEETYKPNASDQTSATRSRHTSETTGPALPQAAGVPGAASNQPAPGTPPVIPGSGSAPSTRRESTVNYELDRTVRHVRQSGASLQRLSVAVVVAHRRETAAGGAATYRAQSEQELEEIAALVKEAVGYNERRGDTIRVASARFIEPELHVAPAPAWWQRPELLALVQDIGRQLLVAAIAIYLALGVLRPLARQWLQARSSAAPPAAESVPEAAAPPAINYEQNLERARQIARQEPKLVANVVRNWVSGHE